ncbi:MAG: hypothetical protein V7K32_16090 [Nostoc sp.]|uniref:hypothetical protein n=1 Tax=Nostoc sp. TaxID=1180 RepID=UPI002FFAD102
MAVERLRLKYWCIAVLVQKNNAIQTSRMNLVMGLRNAIALGKISFIPSTGKNLTAVVVRILIKFSHYNCSQYWE